MKELNHCKWVFSLEIDLYEPRATNFVIKDVCLEMISTLSPTDT